MRTEAAAHADRCVRLLFHPDLGLFGGGRDDASARASVHDQTLALMLDLVPEHHQRMLETRLLP